MRPALSEVESLQTTQANITKLTSLIASRTDTTVDLWGRSEEFREVVRKLFDPIYRYWFRVEWEGLENIPMEGPALLVSNHSGALPPDALSIMHGIETELNRPVYGLADNLFRTIPGLSIAWSRAGGVSANPDNAYRLLKDEGQLVLSFPEGIRGPLKTFDERYSLRRFGRGGFVETAMKSGAPIVPIAVIGAEESMPVVAKIPLPRNPLAMPYLPFTYNHLVMGPILGSFVWFPTKIRIRALKPVYLKAKPNGSRYPRSQIMEESTKIEAMIRSAISEMLRNRRNVILG